jgi:hypothetical protein
MDNAMLSNLLLATLLSITTPADSVNIIQDPSKAVFSQEIGKKGKIRISTGPSASQITGKKGKIRINSDYTYTTQ